VIRATAKTMALMSLKHYYSVVSTVNGQFGRFTCFLKKNLFFYHLVTDHSGCRINNDIFTTEPGEQLAAVFSNAARYYIVTFKRSA